MMRRIEEEAQAIEFERPGANPSISGMQSPLHKTFEPIANRLGFETYAELRDNFVLLCSRVERDIESIQVRRPSTKERWLAAVDTASKVFDASNFSDDCQTVFNSCLLYTSPSPRDLSTSRMPSSA